MTNRPMARALPNRSRRCRILFALPLLLVTGACHTVEFYEKGALSDPTMTYSRSAAQLHWDAKIKYSDEGAAGGIGTSAGGGCGCY